MWKYSLLCCIAFVTTAFAQDDSEVAERNVDKCLDVKCGLGEMCIEGQCACLDSCIEEWRNHDHALCVDDVNYNHECDLWRNQCYCRRNDERCGVEFNGHKPDSNPAIHYYGRCQNFNDICNWDLQKATFPQRFAAWFRHLFNAKWSVSADNMDDESLLRPMDSKSRSNAENVLKRSTSDNEPSIELLSYWFCEMDRNFNGELDVKEVSRLTQLLLPSEPCVTVFLGTCRTKGIIDGREWLNCFNIPDSTVNCRNV